MNEARREIVWKHRKFSNTKTQIFAQLTIYKLEHLFKFLPPRAAIYLLAVWCVCSRFATAGCVVVLTHREREVSRVRTLLVEICDIQTVMLPSGKALQPPEKAYQHNAC